MSANEPIAATAPSCSVMIKTFISIACIIAISVAGFVYKMTAPRVMSPKELVNNGAIVYQEPKTILPFELHTQDNEAFALDDLKGKWTLMFFGFSHCPDFCPTTLATLKTLVNQLDKELQQKLQVVMVSVDPSRDTPERLKQYFDGFQFDTQDTPFIGLTGEFVTIKIMANQFYIPVQKNMLTDEDDSRMKGSDQETLDHSEHMGADKNYTVIHGENMVLVNPEGRYHGFFKPPFSLARLKVTLRSIVATYEQ